MNNRLYVHASDMHASFCATADDIPTCVYRGPRVVATYVSGVADGQCTVLYHTWGDALHWRRVMQTAFEAAAVSGLVFVFVDNDTRARTSFV